MNDVIYFRASKGSRLHDNCDHESASLDPFKVLFLFFPVVTGNCTLLSLLRSLYEHCSIGYRCIRCNIVDRGVRKTSTQRLLSILLLHLNRFEYTNVARKHQMFVDFPLQQLSVLNKNSFKGSYLILIIQFYITCPQLQISMEPRTMDTIPLLLQASPEKPVV